MMVPCILCLPKQSTVVATKPPHMRLCWVEIPAQTTSGWCTPVPFLLHIHLHRHVHVHAPRKIASITVISTLCNTQRKYSESWAAFWMISFMLWPTVRNLAQCSPQRHGVMVENKQDRTARGLALTFHWPPISLHLCLAPLSACFRLSPFGAHWGQVWSHWDVEMCV